jgi:hypothetical protein
VRLGLFYVQTRAKNARVIGPFFVFHFAVLSIDAASLADRVVFKADGADSEVLTVIEM